MKTICSGSTFLREVLLEGNAVESWQLGVKHAPDIWLR